MIGVVDGTGHIIPANNDEANGELIGRVNALHDWIEKEANDRVKSSYDFSEALSCDLQTVCVLMGFSELLKIKTKKEKEKEEVLPSLTFEDVMATTGNADDLADASEVLGAEE